ncbi:hypothetical protein GALMADRAFT_144637 [Galerina marginata CBS 339.88]|uniref:Uncharacterized protein n=1 Tax=Galerina marginata (strain CBS 339.88) TaxID=685588 RepID=A0A067SRJ4_GALM3|nr:hypothetical protein GALMADRAFT_144637 [Galerina marginata CBS 339.88]
MTTRKAQTMSQTATITAFVACRPIPPSRGPTSPDNGPTLPALTLLHSGGGDSQPGSASPTSPSSSVSRSRDVSAGPTLSLSFESAAPASLLLVLVVACWSPVARAG